MPKALILGANGRIGSHSAAAFSHAGWEVSHYVRGTDMTKAADGADVIVNGLNPPNYHNWAVLLPRITEEVITAAQASGATVILPGNVYNFGRAPSPWSENTPHAACSRKGRIRVEMEARYRSSGVRTIVLRGGNFIDPWGNGDVMEVVYLRALKRGRITLPAGADVMQPFCYLPDWAKAAVMLAERRDSLAPFEDVPFPGHVFSAAMLKAELEEALGRPLRTTPFPWLIMRLTAPFWELARELLEMRYLWDLPHRLDGAKLSRLLPEFQPTELQTVMRAGLLRDVQPDQPMRAGQKAIAAD